MGRDDLIFVKLQGGKDEHLFSYSASELEELIDELNLSMVSICDNDLDTNPFIKAISLLTEIKLCAKKELRRVK